MKEKLYTIQIKDALTCGEECPCCYLQRKLEQDCVAFVLGSSYMESNIRTITDREGFCEAHTKMLYDYGNSLGSAWIFKTHLAYLRSELKKQPLQQKKIKKQTVVSWIKDQQCQCYICNKMGQSYNQMLKTFAYMLEKSPEMEELLSETKGFCIPHFADIIETCETELSKKKQEYYLPLLMDLMNQHLDRVQEDIN